MKHKTQNTKHKTQNTKHKLLTKLLLLLLTLSFINCQEEPIQVPSQANLEHPRTNFKIDKLNIEHLEQEVILQSLTTKFNISQPIYNRKKGTYQSQARTSSSSNSNDYWIDMSFVNKITSDNYVSYTMRLVEPLDASYSYSNIVIQERNGVEEIFTIRYINDDNARTNGTDGMNMKSGIIPYDGWEDPDDGNTGGGDDDFVEICNDIRVLTPIPCGCGHMPWETCKGSTCGNPLYPSLEIVTQQECYLDYTGGNGNTGGTGNIASGNTGGGTNQDPTDPEDPDIVTTPISSVLPDGALLTIAECITPNQEQLDWINEQQTKPDGSQELTSVWSYINENNCDDKSEAFLEEAIDVLIDNGEVDLPREIIKDSSFINTKADCIYKKLLSSASGFKNAIKKFDGEFPVAHLKFESDSAMPSNTKKAYTRPPQNYVIDIVLNGNSNKDASYQKRPNLLVVKTIIHEVIHAEMFRKLLSLANNNGSIDVELLKYTLLQGDYIGMLDYYYRYGNTINSTWQHQQMAAHYRETIARILQEFDTGIAVPNDEQPSQLYLDLSWEGLNHSNLIAWQEAITQEERDRINLVIEDYISQYPNQNCTE